MKPSVTQVLQPYVDYSQIPAGTLAAAQFRGTVVDQACAAYARGLMPIIYDEYRGHFESFKIWFDRHVAKVLLNHKRLVGPDFHGEPDFVFVLKGERTPTLWDVKTPVKEGPTWGAQQAAYKKLIWIVKKIEIARCYALQTKADGKIAEALEFQDGPRDLAAFLNALSAWKYFMK